jgi:hypothetical protein
LLFQYRQIGRMVPVYPSTFDVEVIRAQIRKLSDAELIREGRAARQLVSPGGRNGKPPWEDFLWAWRSAWRSGAAGIRARNFSG